LRQKKPKPGKCGFPAKSQKGFARAALDKGGGAVLLFKTLPRTGKIKAGV